MNARLRDFFSRAFNCACGLMVFLGLLVLFILAYWLVVWLADKGLFPRIRGPFD